MGCELPFGFAVLTVVLVFEGCSSPDTACTCAVQNNNERRTLACGDSVCVGGNVMSCTAQDQSVKGGVCTEPPPPIGVDSGLNPPPSSPPPDHSCDDLANFCGTSCNSPAATASDCQSTASAGNPGACASWTLTNGALCHP